MTNQFKVKVVLFLLLLSNICLADQIDYILSVTKERETLLVNNQVLSPTFVISTSKNLVIDIQNNTDETLMFTWRDGSHRYYRIGPREYKELEINPKKGGEYFHSIESLSSSKLNRLFGVVVIQEDSQDSIDEKKKISGKFEKKQYDNLSKLKLEINKGTWEIEFSATLKYEDYKKLTKKDYQILVKKMVLEKLQLVAGVDYLDDKSINSVLGFIYTLPGLISAEFLTHSNGKVKLSFKKKIVLNEKLSLEIEPSVKYKDIWSYKLELELIYRLRENIHVGLLYEYDLRENDSFFGIGFTFKF